MRKQCVADFDNAFESIAEFLMGVYATLWSFTSLSSVFFALINF